MSSCISHVRVENDTLLMDLEGRLDSLNAAETEEVGLQALKTFPGLPVVMDAEKLTYISSSGLRILLKMKKAASADMSVLNASHEVYAIFEVTGMSSLLDVRKKLRTVSVEGCDVLGKGAFGTVYRLDGDTVVKVYRTGEAAIPDIERERENSRKAFMAGVPTAIPFDVVRVTMPPEPDQFGAVYELINARSCSELVRQNPAVLSDLIPRYAAFLKNLHSLTVPSGQLKSLRDKYLNYLEVIAASLSEKTAARLRELLTAMPEDNRVIHGDLTMNNLMVSDDELILIDMDHLSTGNPVFEFASLFAAYVAFNEDDPDDSLRFHGLSQETAARIYHETFSAYLEGMAAEKAEEKAQIMGYLRFLKILIIEQEERKDDLKALQIRHTAEHLDRLVFGVDSLIL